MKHYLINTSVDWRDEFDMPFYELLDGNMYRIYMYAKLKLGSAFTTKGFGTNEAWEYEVYQGKEYGLDYNKLVEDYKERQKYNVFYLQNWANNYTFKGTKRYRRTLF